MSRVPNSRGLPEAPPAPDKPDDCKAPDALAGDSGRSAHDVSESSSAPVLSTSTRLFVRARQGDPDALDRLFAHLLPSIQRWARGRLPGWARRRLDTADLVQEAFVNLFRRLAHVEPKRRRALRAYLQESIRNRIRDEIRRAGLGERSGQDSSGWLDPGTSPLDRAIAAQNAERYRTALKKLAADEQVLIVGRIELGYSYEQLAIATGRPSSDAARVAVRRALLHLAQEIAGV
jgi:RNA polymerase sigma factor (sigma-70 family)